jgi:hypothetical protein
LYRQECAPFLLQVTNETPYRNIKMLLTTESTSGMTYLHENSWQHYRNYSTKMQRSDRVEKNPATALT